MKQRVPTLLIGMLLGAALCGGTALAAAGLLAEPSTQTFYVDGKQVSLEAYAINGHNYIQLRDIARAVDFGVVYDGDTNSVQVNSDASYVEETPDPKPDAKTTNADGSINLPDGDAWLELKEGDVIRCDDGANYTITDMSLYDKSAFAEAHGFYCGICLTDCGACGYNYRR